MRVLVAGATGRVGSAAVRGLLEQGVRVRALVRSSSSGWVKAMVARGVELAPGDVLRPPSLRSVCAGVDVVVSAVTQPGRVAAIEIQGNANLSDAARLAGVQHYIYISAIGADQAGAAPELAARGRVEALLHQSGLPTTILRPAIFYETLSLALLGDTALVARASAQRCGWVAAADVGRSAAFCCGRAEFAGATLDLAGPELLTCIDAYAALGRGRGRPVRLHHVPFALLRLVRPLFPKLAELAEWMVCCNAHSASVDPTLIERRFGFRPQRIEEWARYRLGRELSSMRLSYRLSAALILVCAAFAFHATPAAACTPPPGGPITFTVAERTRAASVVLVGRVISTTGDYGSYVATVHLQEYIKGSGPATVAITGFGPGSLCLSEVTVGQMAIFFTNGDPFDQLSAHYTGQFDATAPATPAAIAEAHAASAVRPQAWQPLVLSQPSALVDAMLAPSGRMALITSVLLVALGGVGLVVGVVRRINEGRSSGD